MQWSPTLVFLSNNRTKLGHNNGEPADRKRLKGKNKTFLTTFVFFIFLQNSH